MPQSIISALAASPILTLFVVIGLGYVLGELSFFGFRFGIAGVLFVGLAVGAFSPDISAGMPEVVPTLGLIVAVYTIGIASGPAFFQSFKARGWRDSAFTAAVVAAGALVAFLVAWPLGLDGARRAGLYCGALTSTPALAAVRETLRFTGRQQGLSPEQLLAIGEEPTVAYSIAYPVGIIGVLLCIWVLRLIWKPEFEGDSRGREITVRNFAVTNPAVIGKTIREVLQPHRDPGFVISRIRQKEKSDVARSDFRLDAGDVVAVVGDEESFARAEQIFGAASPLHIEYDRSELDIRRFIVSEPSIVGKRVRDLELEDNLGATVTRVRRADVDIIPTPDTRLEFGDRVRILGRTINFDRLSKFFGDSIRGTAEADFGSVALGMVVGVLVGMIPIPMPGGGTLRLGLAGGPLLVALLLGKIERTGRVTWILPVSANYTLRQIGFLFFLAGVGVRAGWQFWQTLQSNGWQLVVGGAAVTFTVALLTLIIGYKILKIPYDVLSGLVSGVQTQPACLVYANRMTNSEVPNVAYASVYPAAMITKILLAQILT